MAGVQVVQLELGESPLGHLQQLGMALDRVHPARDTRQDRRLVAGTGADLQHLGTVGQFEGLGHEGHHERLADGLAGSDRQRPVLPGLVQEGRVDEQLARHPLERPEHRAADDAAAPQAHDQADLAGLVVAQWKVSASLVSVG